MNYAYLGGNNYQITLTFYRDCINGNTPFDSIASIGIFDKFNNLLGDLRVRPFDSLTVPPTLSSPCLVPPANICYKVAHYKVNVTLPPRAGGYKIVYQRCCR